MKKREQVVVLTNKLLNSIRSDLDVLSDDDRTKKLILIELRYQLWKEVNKYK